MSSGNPAIDKERNIPSNQVDDG